MTTDLQKLEAAIGADVPRCFNLMCQAQIEFFKKDSCPDCGGQGKHFPYLPMSTAEAKDCPTCGGTGLRQSAAEGVLALATAGMRLLEYANQQSVVEKVSADSLFDNLTSWLELCEKESAEAATKAERLQSVLDRSRLHRQKTEAVVSDLMELAYQLVPGPVVRDGDHALKLIKSSWHRIQRERVYQKARAEAAEAELAELKNPVRTGVCEVCNLKAAAGLSSMTAEQAIAIALLKDALRCIQRFIAGSQLTDPELGPQEEISLEAKIRDFLETNHHDTTVKENFTLDAWGEIFAFGLKQKARAEAAEAIAQGMRETCDSAMQDATEFERPMKKAEMVIEFRVRDGDSRIIPICPKCRKESYFELIGGNKYYCEYCSIFFRFQDRELRFVECDEEK